MTTMLTDHVRGYVDRVRAHLADLPADDVDDLLCGLTADLTETLLDGPLVPPTGAGQGPDLDAVFGPPGEYATELRRAAGLPAARSTADAGRPGLRSRGRATVGALRSTRAWSASRDFLASLRPAWWVLRGLAAGVVALVVVGGVHREVWTMPAGWLVLAAVVVASVQWGRRGTRAERTRPRWIGGAVNAVGAVAVLGAIAATQAAADSDRDRVWAEAQSVGYQMTAVDTSGYAAEWRPDDGVWVDGMQVSNLFVYDADGDPVPGAQVFDDRGRPVQTVGPEVREASWSVYGVDGTWLYQPAAAVDGRGRWNAYPLRAVEDRDVRWDDETGEQVPTSPSAVQDMPWPFAKAPALAPPEALAPPTGTLQSAEGSPTP